MARVSIPTPKIVADPVYGIFDIRPVLSIVETEEFQALGDKRQLGMAYLTFPSATHSRKAHSLGSYHATRELANRWIALKLISREEGDALAAFALCHDIGHPAFSHVTENLCRLDNSGLSLEIVRKLKKEIAASGANYKLVESYAAGKDPLHLAVKDKNLGMEKLDYLERDGLATLLSRPMGVDYLRQHIYFIDGRLAIDEKAVDSAIEAQNFYMKMYKNVYLRKASVIAQRMLQKMVYHLILSNEIARDDLPAMTDSELLGILRVTKNDTARKLYALLRKRCLFRETITIRNRSFTEGTGVTEKGVFSVGIETARMRALVKAPMLQARNQESLRSIEARIAQVAKLPAEAVLVVPVFSPSRFKPQDILVYRPKGEFRSLRDQYPAHFESMEELGMAYVAFRICAPEEHRKALATPKTAKAVIELVLSFAS